MASTNKCTYCGKEFAKERTLQVHLCEPKRRYLQRDEKWMYNFFDFMKKHKFQFSGLQHKHNKIKLTFVTAKECTMFALKYAGRKK